MMKSRSIALLAVLAAGLAACGGRVDLKPAAGNTMPPKPAGAPQAPTIAELMQATPQARPQRNAELLIRSGERSDDEFDLPPGGNSD